MKGYEENAAYPARTLMESVEVIETGQHPNGEPILAMLVSERPAKKVLVTGASPTTVDATEFLGVSVVSILAGANIKVYDAATATGDPVIQVAATALSTLANAMLPSPVQLFSGKLTIQPSGIGTAKAWVFYR